MYLRFIIFLFVSVIYGCASIPVTTWVCPKPKHTMRFATYNVYWENSSKNKCSPDSIINILDTLNADIVVLQETYCFSKQKIDHTLKGKYPYQMFRNCSEKGHEDGLGILSKYPIVKNWYFPPIYGWFPGWLYLIKTPRGYIQVLNVHLNPPLVSDDSIGLFGEALWNTPPKRRAEINYYYQFLNPKLPVLIAGDFNESDSGAAANYLRNHCFNDILLKYVPKNIITWHYRWGFINLSGRYDRIYSIGKITPVNAQVYQKGHSDHYPVVLDFCKY